MTTSPKVNLIKKTQTDDHQSSDLQPKKIQFLLVDAGLCSRREAAEWIKEGRVTVNGKVVKNPSLEFETDKLHIKVDGKLIDSKPVPKVYWLLNKPDMILTSRESQDPGQKTIYDLPMIKKTKYLVSPVGRLDYRTEGLLLLTNDGEMNQRLCLPTYHVPREYQVLSSKRLTDDQLKELRDGIKLRDGIVKNIKIRFVHGEKLGVSKGSWYIVTVREGRNRLVRRIFDHFDSKVVRLIRTGFHELRLTPSLKPGTYRQLTSPEILSLKKVTKLYKKPTRKSTKEEESP